MFLIGLLPDNARAASPPPAQGALDEISRLRSPRPPLMFDFTVDSYNSPPLSALGSGPLVLPDTPSLRTEGRARTDGDRVRIEKRETLWSNGESVQSGKSISLYDGKRFWNIEEPPSPGLWCPTVWTNSRSGKEMGAEAISGIGGALEGRFAFISGGDWIALASRIPPERLTTGNEAIGPFPCRKVQFRQGNGQYTFWIDLQHGALPRQARIVIREKSVSWWRKILLRRPNELEKTTYEIRDVDIRKVGGIDLPVSGAIVTRFSYRSGESFSNVARIRRTNIAPQSGPAVQGAFEPGLPEGTIVDDVSYALKYEWRGGELQPFLDPALAASIGESMRRIDGETRSAPPPLLRGLHVSPVAPVLPEPLGSPPSEHCYDALGPRDGLYCLYAALHLTGIRVKPDSLFRSEYLNKADGSSAAQLAAAGRNHGLQARAVTGLTPRTLAESRWPIVLRVRSKIYSKKNDGWELFLGAREGQAWILDPARGPRMESFPALANRWDGSGVVLSNKPINLLRLKTPDIRFALLVCIPLLFIVWVIGRIARRRSSAPSNTGFFRFARRSVWEGFALAALAVVGALLWNALADGGLLSTTSAAEGVRISRAGFFSPGADVGRVRSISKGTEKALLLDARDPKDFYGGHIPGAKNAPLLANDADFRASLAGVNRTTPVVVYCGSITCHMAERLAARMAAEGFSQIEIFKGGWVEWNESQKKNPQV